MSIKKSTKSEMVADKLASVKDVEAKLNHGIERSTEEREACVVWLTGFMAANQLTLKQLDAMCSDDPAWVFEQIFGDVQKNTFAARTVESQQCGNPGTASYDSDLEYAKTLIQLFCIREYGNGDNSDFSDLENVSLAYTDYEESEHGPYKVQVNADLIHFQIRTYVNDILVSTVACSSLKELCNDHLDWMNFDDLVWITDEEWNTYFNTVAANNGKKVEAIRAEYPHGTRIRLIRMAPDPQPIEPGSTGTVEHVDDMGQLQMQWDCHRSLALIPGVDIFEIISKPN